MFNNTDLSAPLESLHFGSTTSVPVTVESWYGDEDGMGDTDFEFFEAATVTLPDGRDVAAVFTSDKAAKLALDDHGTVVDLEDADDYITDHQDDDGETADGRLSDDQVSALVDGRRSLGGLDSVEGPMMNYWYPVESITDDGEAASAAMWVRDLPLCVVRVSDAYGLALTGGGMDLSWEIVEAFTRLGLLPPVHFSDLPSMAGAYVPENKTGAYVMQAMLRSLDAQAASLVRSAERLRERYPAWS